MRRKDRKCIERTKEIDRTDDRSFWWHTALPCLSRISCTLIIIKCNYLNHLPTNTHPCGSRLVFQFQHAGRNCVHCAVKNHIDFTLNALLLVVFLLCSFVVVTFAHFWTHLWFCADLCASVFGLNDFGNSTNWFSLAFRSNLLMVVCVFGFIFKCLFLHLRLNKVNSIYSQCECIHVVLSHQIIVAAFETRNMKYNTHGIHIFYINHDYLWRKHN